MRRGGGAGGTPDWRCGVHLVSLEIKIKRLGKSPILRESNFILICWSLSTTQTLDLEHLLCRSTFVKKRPK